MSDQHTQRLHNIEQRLVSLSTSSAMTFGRSSSGSTRFAPRSAAR